jgi:hypothetical protein
MDSRQKLPAATIPINKLRIPSLFLSGEFFDVKIIEYPYWTKIQFLN